MNLTDVSQTAIWTLICRANQAEKKNQRIDDRMAVLCLDKMISLASVEDKSRLLKWKRMAAGIGASDAGHIAWRASEIDRVVNDYISKHPSCTVINLACGFDTRFWRIENSKCRYLELDLPEVIALKKEILNGHLNYELMGHSVLDTTWIDKVTSNGNSNFLLIAEGLFMYLPKTDATRLLQSIAQRFYRSQFVLDMASEKMATGIMQKIGAWKFKFFMGINASIEFGLQDPHNIETYGSGFKIMDVSNPEGAYRSMHYLITASINGNA